MLCRLDFCLGTGWTIAGAGIPYVLVALLNGWRVMGPLAYLSQSSCKMAAGGSGVLGAGLTIDQGEQHVVGMCPVMGATCRHVSYNISYIGATCWHVYYNIPSIGATCSHVSYNIPSIVATCRHVSYNIPYIGATCRHVYYNIPSIGATCRHVSLNLETLPSPLV